MKILNKYYFWVIILLLMVLPFFVLSFFVFPSADDYSIANLVDQYGYWTYQKYVYLHWTGRYTANLIEAFNPMQNILIYRIIPVFLMVLLFASLFSFFRTFLKYYLTTCQLFLFTLIFFTLYLNTFPSTGEGIYWFPAGIEYVLANILTLFFAKMLYLMMNAAGRMKLAYWSIAAVLSIMITGLNEISLAVVCCLCFMAFAARTFITRKLSVSLVLLLFVVLLFAAIDIIAPGNFERMSVFSETMNFGKSLVNACVSLFKLLGIHFQNPPFILISVLAIPSIIQIIRTNSIRYRFLIHPILLAVFSLFLLLLLYIPGYLSMGLNPPMRVNSTLSLVFMILWFINTVNFSHFIYRKKTMIPELPEKLVTVLLVCTVVLALTDFSKEPAKDYIFRGNIPGAYYDLFCKAGYFKYEMDSRLEIINRAKASGVYEVSFDKLKSVPRTIFFVDIKEDSSHWINHNYARYYGLKSVWLKK